MNWPLVKFHCWEDKFDVNQFGERIIVINEEKWFIKKFVLFQQKIATLDELNPSNKCHASIIKLLSAEGISVSPLQAPKKGLPRALGNSIGIGNNTTNTTIDINIIYEFEPLWQKYPNKDGKKAALRSFKSSVKTPKDYDDIQIALTNYLQSEKVSKGFIKNGSTWFNNWRDWVTVSNGLTLSPAQQKLKDMGYKL